MKRKSGTQKTKVVKDPKLSQTHTELRSSEKYFVDFSLVEAE